LPQGGVRYFRRYLFDQTAVESDWSLGMVRDMNRNVIPTGGSYTLMDFFVERPGSLYKRGGTTFLCSSIPGMDDVIGMAACEFRGDPRVLAFASHSGGAATEVWDVTSGTATGGVDVNAAQPVENLTYWGSGATDRLILTSAQPSAGPYYGPQKVYLSGGTVTVGLLGGSPPAAKYSCVHAGRLVLGNTFADPDMIFFSPPSSPTHSDVEDPWDTTNSWIRTGAPITGLASIQGILLVFSRGRCQRILGSIPPGHVDAAGNANTDMDLQPLGNVGCIDARSICFANNLCYFANEKGIYYTNGAGFNSLTEKANGTGISSYWQDTMKGFSPGLGAVVSMGVYQNQYLLVSMIHNSGQKAQFVCHLPTEAWMQTSTPTSATMYAPSFAPSHELYIGSSADTGVRKLSTMWTPNSSVKNDAEGTAVLPLWESRVISTSVGLKRYGFGHLTYDIRDVFADNPSLEVQIATGLNVDSGFVDVRESSLQKTTEVTRKRFSVYKDTPGLTYRINQLNPSERTILYFLETEIGQFLVAEAQ
jgi:hypothetical protein